MKYFFLIVIILLSKLTFGQTNQYSEIVNYYNTVQNFNGAVLVATNGQIDYLAGIGVSNRQAGTTMNSKTKFKIASITKTFTAVLILQLYQEGKIDLNATFGKYYPNYKGEAKDKVTIENLLTYSSGIPNAVKNLWMRPYQLPITIDEFIDKYCSENLEFTPGEKSNYSNTEYTILHKIIENVSKKSFSSLLQENILNPLKMENTGLLNSKDIIPGLTSSYTIEDSTNQITSDEPYFIENYFGSAAMYSTVEDLFKFNNGIFNYSLLNESTTKLMLKPNNKLDGAALGGFWYSDGYGTFNKPFIYRTGGLLGSCSNWIHSIDDKKTIIVFNNTNRTNLYELSEQLYLVSTGQKATIPILKKQENSSNALNLDKVKGTWLLDLRPDPNSEPYLKDFILTPTKGKEFEGEFYGTKFTGGYFNTDWENLYFAFTTGDKDNVYYHSGYIIDDKIFGISYSEGRKFTSHWTGIKK
ncbi:serine hydrolase domain-containing protein [Flavobacterium paronense]|uniref:Serine hydrolase domain-containing protein n=1 Tax=Flavobacterium paronense TaxID=1392775 RepID=A0ABV5GGX4_9FLAO|nr:serine hydrolase domain-containing protein [Flavobacterium paronense]MDN3677258.1 serine hydrolase domain-containing protein [Flavobacterium paronense]